MKKYINKKRNKMAASRNEIQKQFLFPDRKDRKETILAFNNSGMTYTQKSLNKSYGPIVKYYENNCMKKDVHE